jgi:hypothetical protein
MKKLQIRKNHCEETNEWIWAVSRIDGKSFHDGVVSYNFTYSEEGGLLAIDCAKKLEQEFAGE